MLNNSPTERGHSEEHDKADSQPAPQLLDMSDDG
jgi:hypothetical protein